ncbi:hypothetical protein [Burkholderia sp. Ac-20349]|uniref:hypothetical protein n=1 Tax=Burkholderia sp. Ac-20349 TaxID=2703893 RepID=UPI00197C3211|nr:hypothetical protein [Burkholderia sp. Ac-20349]MBN3839337.1 hypothetical protein [Burkholderia sp. Ac-20349]
MTTTNKTQMRGNCQCCMRDQAVLDTGRMSKHGYTVKGGPGYGWFSGICSGQHHRPLQKDRSHLDTIVVVIRKDSANLERRARALRDGSVKPETAKEGPSSKAKEIPFAEANAYQQRQAIDSAIYSAESRSRNGFKLADEMVQFADKVHGTALREVKVDAGPAPIKLGEKRISSGNGRVLEATELRGGRVYWKDSKGFKSWTGTQSWRRFALAD